MLVWACKPIPGDLRQPHWAGMVMVVEGVLMVGGGCSTSRRSVWLLIKSLETLKAASRD